MDIWFKDPSLVSHGHEQQLLSPPPSDPSDGGCSSEPLDVRPRILCLHGGGVTASVFQTQCRRLIRHLPAFRLVFADGPCYSEPGPGIVPVYESKGPFRRWLRWKPEHPDVTNDEAVAMILTSLERCKAADSGTGPWVGLLGFSQGAKVAASLLYDQQVKRDKSESLWKDLGNGCHRDSGSEYLFGVLLAGRGPLLSLCPHSASPALMTPRELSTGYFDYPFDSPHVLRLPTIHVHGTRDIGLPWHRKLANQYCDPKATTTVEWDGDHRVPVKTKDVARVAIEIYRVARERGIDV